MQVSNSLFSWKRLSICLYSKDLNTGPGLTSLAFTLTTDPVIACEFMKSGHSTEIALNPLQMVYFHMFDLTLLYWSVRSNAVIRGMVRGRRGEK